MSIQGDVFKQGVVGKYSGVVAVQAAITLDFSKLSKRERNALRAAVDTNLLTALQGRTSDIFRTISMALKWPKPHLWTRSNWSGSVFRVSRADFETHIAPFLVAIAPLGYTPVWASPHWGEHEPYGTLRHVEQTNSYTNPKVGIKLPEVVISKLKELDTRDRDEVNRVLHMIDSGATFAFNYNIK